MCFHVHMCFACVYVYVLHVHSIHKSQKRGLQTPRFRVTDGCNSHMWVLETDPESTGTVARSLSG